MPAQSLAAEKSAKTPRDVGERWRSPEEIAAKVGCSVSHVRREIARGLLRSSKLGSLVRVSESALTEYLTANEQRRETYNKRTGRRGRPVEAGR